jgi:hypothetical protein
MFGIAKLTIAYAGFSFGEARGIFPWHSTLKSVGCTGIVIQHDNTVITYTHWEDFVMWVVHFVHT